MPCFSSHSRISIYEKQIVELVRQQPAQEQERTNKENDFNLKSKENQIRQQEINQLNAQLDSMNRSALQEKKSTLETIKENLQKAQNALIVLEDKKGGFGHSRGKREITGNQSASRQEPERET